MYDKLKILYIEDSENDAVLMTLHLKGICKNIYYKRVESKIELTKALKKEKWDIIIIDGSLPTMTAIDAINLIKKKGVDTSIICVSGSEMFDIKDQCLNAGAEAFVLKDNADEFVKVVEKILQKSFG
ncbi:MAG: response regulator [Candidatus Heimdallarchaeota archaeon]|nr:MAG: response regulator [Candidatus Heimdallarchaeota archaeon]